MKFALGAVLLASCLAGAMAEDSPIVATTLEFLARASSTSEVLTLNLTNLFILGALAVLAVALGIFAGDGTARSADGDSQSMITQSVMTGGMCFLMFTSGAEEKLSCIQRSACEDPKSASDYLTAAKMWYKMHKLMKAVPFTDKYYTIMTSVNEATEHSLNGGDCTRYQW